MRDSVCRKIILSLLDCIPKSVQEISENICEPSETVEVQLTRLASENICEAQSDNEVTQWTVKKDIETFAQLVQDFISSDEPSEDEKSQFVTSPLYLNRIDLELVDFVIGRFHLDLEYRTLDEKETLRRLLLVSPSGLCFALHSDEQGFDEFWSSQTQLNASDSTRESIAELAHIHFQNNLMGALVNDIKRTTFIPLYARLQLLAVKNSINISLATPIEKFVDLSSSANFTFNLLGGGQFDTSANPMSIFNEAFAFFHVGAFQTALEKFDMGINEALDPLQKANALNFKGWAYINLKQYQKAIECFETGIELDSEGEISILRAHKQIAEEYLTRATDADNLTQPTRIRFILNQPIVFEETLFYEFKTIKEYSNNPVSPITNTADEYAVAFLNGKGGRIFWGIGNSDRITVGVSLDELQRDEIRTQVSQKLWSIRPPIVDEDWHFEFHNIYDLQGQTIENLWVIELVIAPSREKNVFYTNSGELFVKTDGGKQKLLGPQVTEFVRDHFRNKTD